jgi:antitoxin ParD1/3/4
MSDVETINVALSRQQAALLRAAVDAGEYATTSEIVQEAVRGWEEKRALRLADADRLRTLWDEGKASGAARKLDFQDLRREARAQLVEAKADGR